VAVLTRAIRIALLLSAVLLVGVGEVRARIGSVTEAQAKAALLYNFLAFVEWPPGAADDKRFVIGVAGDADVLDALRPVAGQAVKGHAVLVREIREEDDPTQCHVLYLSAARDRMTAAILRRVAGAPVLTVSDGNEFARRGGIVFVYFDQSRLRFDVSLANANKAQLKISSKVLGLARTVKSDGPTP
jgi:YfiR/HmsC-like